MSTIARYRRMIYCEELQRPCELEEVRFLVAFDERVREFAATF